MQRSKLFLATAAIVATACEAPTGPDARTLGARPAAADEAPTSQTTFSGEATVVQATVGGMPIALVGTGPLDPSGGAREKTLAELEISEAQTGNLLALRATVGHANTVGQGKRSRSQATVADLALRVAGTPIEASFLDAAASAVCDAAGNAAAAASSMIAELTIAGQSYAVTGQPNQTITVPMLGLTIVLNEQDVKQDGNRADATVTALHVIAEPLGGTKVDVIVARAHADIRCGVCIDNGDDFTTGGGWIVARSGGRANFAVAGGKRHGWGHLTYHDKAEGLKVKGTAVLSYATIPTPEGGTLSIIHGLAEANGEPVTYTVKAADNGEPGRDDTFYIELSNGYMSGSNLGGGNIQFHDRPSRCPVN